MFALSDLTRKRSRENCHQVEEVIDLGAGFVRADVFFELAAEQTAELFYLSIGYSHHADHPAAVANRHDAEIELA